MFAAEVRAAFGNLVWKGLSSSLEKVCRLALVFVSAPLLGPAAFGRFQFATTVTTILALGTELGLGLWTTRELARDRARAATIVATTLRVRLRAAVPYAVVTAVAALLVGPGEQRGAILLLGVSALASAFVDHFAAILRGQAQFQAEARLNTARALLVIGAGLGALALDRSLVALTPGVTVGTLVATGYGVALLGSRGGRYEPSLARAALRDSLPIWMAGVLSLLYFKGDTVLLGWLAGDAALGAYGAAWKLFEGAQILPAMIMAATFPHLARAEGPLRVRWERLTAAVLLGLGLVVGLVFFAGRALLIRALYGPSFAAAVPSLAWLALAVPLMYLNCGLTHFLIARDLARRNVVLAAAMLALNVTLNLVAIPRWGGPGAAAVTVATELALTALCLAALSARGAASPAPASG